MKSSILMGFSIINHPFWVLPFMDTPIYILHYGMATMTTKKTQGDRKINTHIVYMLCIYIYDMLYNNII